MPLPLGAPLLYTTGKTRTLKSMAVVRALRPFMEASLALFAAGAPPVVVAEKFSNAVSYQTVLRWYHDWAELKGIPVDKRYRARKKNEPRHVYQYEKDMKAIAKDKRQRREKQAATRRSRMVKEAGENYEKETEDNE